MDSEQPNCSCERMKRCFEKGRVIQISEEIETEFYPSRIGPGLYQIAEVSQNSQSSTLCHLNKVSKNGKQYKFRAVYPAAALGFLLQEGQARLIEDE